MGLLIGIELRAPDGQPVPLEITYCIESECDKQGVLIQHTHNVIVLYPPLVISD